MSKAQAALDAIELQVNWNDNFGGEIEASLIQFF